MEFEDKKEELEEMTKQRYEKLLQFEREAEIIEE
jgi:hypothetical protein